MPNGHRDATRVLQVVDKLVEGRTKSGAGIDVTYGQVFGLSADGREASVYLAGSRELALSDGGVPEPSDGFRVPSQHMLFASDYVRVAIDVRGHRWIEEYIPSSPYSKVAIDHKNGRIAFGDGTVLPTNFLSLAGGEFGLTSQIRVVRTTSTQDAFYAMIATDTYARYTVRADGQLSWGPGNAVPDISMSRSATGKLFVSNDLDVAGVLTAGVVKAGGIDLDKRTGADATGAALTLTTALQTLPIDSVVDGDALYADTAGNQMEIYTAVGRGGGTNGKAGLYLVSVTVRTTTALAGTSNLRISTRVNGAEDSRLSGYETVPPSSVASIHRAYPIYLAVGDTVDVQALAGAGVTAGAATLYIAIARLASDYNL